MDRQCSWKRTEEVEIDLLDLLRRLGGEWKRMLVCALVFAVLAGAGSYYLSKNGGMDAAKEDAASEEGETQPVPLTKEEQERGVAAARQLAKETAQLEDYVQNSMRMQTDPYHKKSVQLIFRIEGAGGWTTQKIVEKYLDYLSNDRVVSDICRIDRAMEQVDSCFLPELFQAVQKTSGTYTDKEEKQWSGVLLSIDVTGRDEEMATALAADMQKALKAYSSIVKKECGSHTLTLLSSEEKVRMDIDLLFWQREKRTLLTTDQANLKAMLGAFDDTQKAMYAAAADADEKAAEDGEPSAPDNAESTAEGGEASAPDSTEGTAEGVSGLESEAELEAESQEGSNTQAKGSVNVLFVLLGLFGGIFLYGAGYACWYLLRDTVKGAGEFQSYYTFPFYGSISLHRKAGLGDTAQGPDEQKKAQVLNRVRLSCRKRQISSICLAADFTPDEKEKACLESMVGQLREWEIDVLVAENVSGNISVWDALTDVGNVLMVCRIGHTTHRMVDAAMEFYQENGIYVLGAAALE